MLNFGNKKILILVSVVVLAIILILYFTYRAGKRASDLTNVKPPPDVVGTPLTEEETNYLDALAINLYNDMNGMNFIGWNSDLYNSVSLLSDSKLVALSNIYNFKFQQESGQSFLQWLENESFSWDSFSMDTTINTIKNRLRGLGVS